MEKSELDKRNLLLERAEFAAAQLNAKLDELCKRAAKAQTQAQREALKIEWIETTERMRKVGEAMLAQDPAWTAEIQ